MSLQHEYKKAEPMMPSNQSATCKPVSAPIENPPGFPDAHKIYLFAVIVKYKLFR